MSADQPGAAQYGPRGRPGRPDRGSPQTGSTLDFLTGAWTVARAISDRRAGRDGSFLGMAEFAPEGGSLRYAEHGELTFGEYTGPASRTLLYQGRDDGAADVRFADGRDFFCLDLRTGCCQAAHVCRADQYLVTVTVTGPGSFTETWQVTGPAKDYDMTATYRRA